MPSSSGPFNARESVVGSVPQARSRRLARRCAATTAGSALFAALTGVRLGLLSASVRVSMHFIGLINRRTYEESHTREPDPAAVVADRQTEEVIRRRSVRS